MKNNFFVFLRKTFFWAIFSAAFFSCNYGAPMFLFTEEPVDTRASSIKELSQKDLPENFEGSKYSFLVITDSHFGDTRVSRSENEFLELFKGLLQNPDQTLRPRFIVNLGDTLDGGKEDEARDFNRAAKEWILAAKEILLVNDYKVYSILGNHDLYNDGWEIWKEKIWPYTSYYKFTVKTGGQGFSFYALDSGNGTLGGPQIEDLEKNLKADPNPKIVFCHYPLFADGFFYCTFGDTAERNRLIYNFAKNNVKYVFEGHAHKFNSYNFKSFTEVVVPAYLTKQTVALVTVDGSMQNVDYKILEF